VEREDPPGGASEYYVDVRLEGPCPARPGELVAVRPVGVLDCSILAVPALGA